jgi:hypothetical protein
MYIRENTLCIKAKLMSVEMITAQSVRPAIAYFSLSGRYSLASPIKEISSSFPSTGVGFR